MDNFYTSVILVSVGCIAFAVMLVLVLRDFSRKTPKSRSKVASVLVLIALILAATRTTDLNLMTIAQIIGVASIMVCPTWMIIWKYKSKLKTLPIPKWAGPISIPLGLSLWPWLHKLSVVAEYTIYFFISFIFVLIAFFFTEKEINAFKRRL